MNLLDAMIWIPVLMLLAYSIPACYYDLKYRELPVGFWTGLLVVCVPITGALYLSGIYEWYLGALSLGVILLYYMLYQLKFYEGADYTYLTFISLFLVQSPRTGNVLMPVSFGIYLIASVVGCAIVYQLLKKAEIPRVTEMKNVPFLIPISLALWVTVMLA